MHFGGQYPTAYCYFIGLRLLFTESQKLFYFVFVLGLNSIKIQAFVHFCRQSTGALDHVWQAGKGGPRIRAQADWLVAFHFNICLSNCT
jgi:hypothetical protein